MVIIGFNDQGVLHMMAAVVQVAKMGTKVCIIGWTRKKDDMMVIPSTVTAAGNPPCSGQMFTRIGGMLGSELPGNALPQNKLFLVVSVFTWKIPRKYGKFHPVTLKTLRENFNKEKKWRQHGRLFALFFAPIDNFEEDLRPV